jgi:hypothetical protein
MTKLKKLYSLLTISFLILLAIILETTWLSGILVLGVQINLLVIIISLTGIFKGPFWGSLCGVFTGAILGFINSQLIFSLLLWSLLGCLFGFLRTNIFNNLKILALICSFFGTLFLYLFVWIFYTVFSSNTFYFPWTTPLISALINSIIAYFIFPLFKNILITET